MDDRNQISVLAELLRSTGEQILQGDETLVLSESLLKSINDSFTFLVQEDNNGSFQVTQTNNSEVEVFRDIQFLHDFIQKVLRVRIIKYSFSKKKFVININKFRNLRVLELIRVPVQNISGIQQLRAQVKTVKCMHCLHQLQEFLIMCGADKSTACVWEGLTEGIFTHNGMDTVDHSFAYTPWLQKIDLSHNNFKSFSVSVNLPNLKYLNLSFNLLESVPVLNRETLCKLEVLVLKNNYIKDLSALLKYTSLSELDVSCNSLSEHSSLAPLTHLPSLKQLNLVGNPLSFHKQHRIYTAYHLHPNVASSKFVLDNRLLTWRERRRIRKENEIDYLVYDLCDSVNSIADSSLDLSSSMAESGASTSDSAKPVASVHRRSNVPQKHSRQKKQVKEAIISENSLSDDDKIEVPVTVSNNDHLQVKQHIESLREQFGEDNWLVQRGASHVQAVLGLPTLPPPQPNLNTLLQDAIEKDSVPTETECDAPRENNEAAGDVDDSPHMTTEVVKSQEEISTETYPPAVEKSDDSANFLEELLEFDEGKLFTARRGHSSLEVLVALGDNSLQERDVKNGSIREQWELASVQSCELLSSDASSVRLTFDVFRRDRRSCTYLMDAPDAKIFARAIGDILASRSLEEMNQIAYWCMKCSAQFSREENIRISNKGKEAVCPNCKSNIICMMNESVVPKFSTVDNPPSSQTSTSATHLHSTSNKSSPQYSTESTLSLESENSAVTTQRYESDIEVISNPSQSSIEVLDGESRTPARRNSICQLETRVTLPDSSKNIVVGCNVAPVSLTESSSSGSFTDSVCTTYETSKSMTNGSTSEDPDRICSEHGEKDWSSTKLLEKAIEGYSEDGPLYGIEPIPSLQEMFKGLLESVDKKLATHEDQICLPKDDSIIQFSYVDFQLVDHRLQLFILQNLFQSEDEKLLLVLRAEILKTGSSSPYPGLLVLSTQHGWLLRVTGRERDNPEAWLQRDMTWPLGDMGSLFPLPWAQGVGIVVGVDKPSYVLLFLQDPTRMHCFLKAAGAALPTTCKISLDPVNYHQERITELESFSILPGDVNDPVHFMSIFSTFSLQDKACTVNHGLIAVRIRDIFIMGANLSWFFPTPSDNEQIQIVCTQEVGNLLEVETNNSALLLNFVDETNQKQEVWHLTFQTPNCVQEVVCAIRSPWENLFSVPLQVRDEAVQ